MLFCKPICYIQKKEISINIFQLYSILLRIYDTSNITDSMTHGSLYISVCLALYSKRLVEILKSLRIGKTQPSLGFFTHFNRSFYLDPNDFRGLRIALLFESLKLVLRKSICHLYTSREHMVIFTRLILQSSTVESGYLVNCPH